MSKALSKLLGKTEDEVVSLISKLESTCGYPSEDVRMLAQNKHSVRAKMVDLNLDPNDTTDEELYQALRARFAMDSAAIDIDASATGLTSFYDKLDKALQLLKQSIEIDSVWAAKTPALKKILQKSPPKQVAKTLGFRSPASMIKRRDVVEIVLAAEIIESDAWKANFAKAVLHLSASSYEQRPVKLIMMDSKFAGHSTQPPSSMLFSKTVGAIGVWPTFSSETSVLGITLELLEATHELNEVDHKKSLSKLSPQLKWWSECEYLISDGEIPVSFNIRDLALNHSNSHRLADATSKYAAVALWDELVDRYSVITESVQDVLEPKLLPTRKSQSVSLPVSRELAAELAAIE